jgi:hypothetical protein
MLLYFSVEMIFVDLLLQHLFNGIVNRDGITAPCDRHNDICGGKEDIYIRKCYHTLLTLAFCVHTSGHVDQYSACVSLRNYSPNAVTYVKFALLFKYWLCERNTTNMASTICTSKSKRAGNVRGGWRRMSKDIAKPRATECFKCLWNCVAGSRGIVMTWEWMTVCDMFQPSSVSD